MNPWIVRVGRIRESDSTEEWHRTSAYRVSHSRLKATLGVPFSRRQDAERACQLVNESLGDGEIKELYDRAIEKFGGQQEFYKYLLENCCQW